MSIDNISDDPTAPVAKEDVNTNFKPHNASNFSYFLLEFIALLIGLVSFALAAGLSQQARTCGTDCYKIAVTIFILCILGKYNHYKFFG